MLTVFEANFSKTNKFPTFSADFMESESLFDVCKCFNLDTEDFTFSFMTGKNLLWSNRVLLIHTLMFLTYKSFTEVLHKVFCIKRNEKVYIVMVQSGAINTHINFVNLSKFHRDFV